MEQMIYLGIFGGIIALFAAYFYSKKVQSYEINIPRVAEITEAIREGAMAFLSVEYKILIWFVAAVAILLGVFLSPMVALTFVIGALTSALAGNIGMRIATKANGRTAIAAKEGGLSKALDVAFAGGAWDNAKKQIEAGYKGDGKGSDRHKAAVVGDTVGDPFKDTSGPSLNILIKLMSIVSLVLVPLFV